MNCTLLTVLVLISIVYCGNGIGMEQEQKSIAYCITGQLARLEMRSKLQNIIIPNARMGHNVHIYVYADSEVENVKQTYWNFNYSQTVFGKYSRQDLKAYIDKYTENAGFKKDVIRSRVKLEPPTRSEFHVINGKIPVRPKEYSGHDGPKTNFESAETRFQNNMRWMSGLRDCVKWVQLTEYTQGWFYDYIVRLRDDSYALGPWLINHDKYKNALSSSKSGSFQGVNDHNFVVDRRWADVLLRGLVEDYYFNSTLDNVMWGNAEQRIRQIADAYGIPLNVNNICQQPLIPLRGLVNTTHWRLHPLYIRHFHSDCQATHTADNLNTCCEAKWLNTVSSKVASVE